MMPVAMPRFLRGLPRLVLPLERVVVDVMSLDNLIAVVLLVVVAGGSGGSSRHGADDDDRVELRPVRRERSVRPRSMLRPVAPTSGMSGSCQTNSPSERRPARSWDPVACHRGGMTACGVGMARAGTFAPCVCW